MLSQWMRVIGAIDHYAPAELVTLAADDAAPVFVDRRRVKLIDVSGSAGRARLVGGR